MRVLNKPSIPPSNIYDDCTNSLKDQLGLSNERVNFLREVQCYDTKASKHQYDKVCRNQPKHTTAERLKAAYEKGLVRNKRGEPYKNRIIQINNKCPFCSVRFNAQLDHYLPKSIYPMHTVNPFNLVPCCSDCNHTKGSKSPTNPNDCFFHPYYEQCEGQKWLQASCNRSNPEQVTFSIDQTISNNNGLLSRLNYTFRQLNLANLYATLAASEFAERKIHFDRLDTQNLLEHLLSEANIISHTNLNDWRVATYKAWHSFAQQNGGL